MPTKKLSERELQLPLRSGPPTDRIQRPDFARLLATPLVTLPLPRDFDVQAESEHLNRLWTETKELQQYTFESFVHAGGSGMVFRVSSPAADVLPLALKIARQKLMEVSPRNPNIATSLSPVSPRELRALQRISHESVVRLHDALENKRGVFAIVTSYVGTPQPLDQYLLTTLEKHPDPTGEKGLHRFSPQRLDNACSFLVSRFHELASALAHMHALQLYHCDIKPANFLINSDHRGILTDLGACVHPDDVDKNGDLRVQFTWTYAHPELTSLISDPRGISGGGLKASAKVRFDSRMARFDLFAFGRTIQEALAQLVREFGERCYASYGFRFLHLISALTLDGHNTPLSEKIRAQDGRHFVRDAALDYPIEIFSGHRIQAAAELVERLRRFSRDYSWHESLPELDSWQPEVINTGTGGTAPFTRRVGKIFMHSSVRRLRSELQLGWLREVYPGATHTRWSHSIGVFAAVADFYSALLADPEVPTARVLLDADDIAHGLVAAMIHDIGQTAFGHDFEAATPMLYRHEEFILRILDDGEWGKPTLRETIMRFWPEVNIARVIAILREESDDGEGGEGDSGRLHLPVDGIARDIISGPIDADKLDYLARDSEACGVPYGAGIDRQRFLRALTVDAKNLVGGSRLGLAYRAKGAAAIESLLLARYQMYGAVYWHHTFRCIQAMLGHAAAATFGSLSGEHVHLRGHQVGISSLRDLFYFRVVCGHDLRKCKRLLMKSGLPAAFFSDPPAELAQEHALEFIWKCADRRNRDLIERLARRRLFKRVFELRIGDLGEQGDYSALASALVAERRVILCDKMEGRFLDAVYKKMVQRGPIESVSESEARARHGALVKKEFPLVVLDFPIRGIPEERNFPQEISDPARKYISGSRYGAVLGRNVFHTVKRLQVAIASLRVFAAPELHELIVRYLDPEDVQSCVESVLPGLKLFQ